jgi:flavin-dependent dehydrogenase
MIIKKIVAVVAFTLAWMTWPGAAGAITISPGQSIRRDIGSMTIDATGRARVLSRLADKSVARKEPKPRFVGFKAHFSGVVMSPGVCEIYAFHGGYAGLTFVENGEANLCFLAKASTLGGRNNPDIVFSELKKQNIRARTTLTTAKRLHAWLAVSVPAFGLNPFPETDGLFTVGDSAAFVDPFTGSGMLLAMESASTLADCIAECGIDTAAVRSRYLRLIQANFSARLKVSGLIRHIAYNPLLSRAAVIALSLSARSREALARRTRSAKLSEGL